MSDDASNMQRPRRGETRYAELSAGHEGCYECGGDGACRACAGTGRDEDTTCTNCQGTGRCVVCRGAGQIPVEVLTYEQGHEFAPDSRWGLQTLRLRRSGRYDYERRQHGQVVSSSPGLVSAEKATHIFEALARGGFPVVAKHPLPPGATVLRLAMAGTSPARVEVDRRFGLSVPGYREAILELVAIVDEIRDADEE